ncbi:MAG: shikimate dehydrogenase [Acidobacteria bacterium]|nr:shikimate dehydrogenase [Acidobacteriota bacterium]
MAPRSFPQRIALVVAERSPQAFWRAIVRAGRRARLLELRLDALGSVADIVSVLERLARRPTRLTLIATCRRVAQGGGFRGSASAQLALLSLAAHAGCAWVDVDAETLEAFPPALRAALLPPARRIVSLHDFRRTPPRLPRLYQRLRRLGADVVKIAVTPRRQRDNLALLELARRHRRRVIAVGMGTVGFPARVLALQAGCALTYARLADAPSPVPGLPSLEELRDEYRADRLRARTRLYGVIGHPIAHSLSPPMHNAAFHAAGLDSVYLPFDVERLPDFLACVRPLGIAGFSVTLPHKQTILRYLDAIDPLAKAIGAVNTVVVRGDGALYGYNTDYVGVLRTLERYVRLEGARVLLVGAGGAARAVAFALATAGAFISVTARRPAAARALAAAVSGEALSRSMVHRRQFDAIINCTPVGQVPDVNASPLQAEALNCRVLFDLVYNPPETRLLRLGRARRIQIVPGWQMLVEQGAAQFEIWTGLRAPLAVMRRAVLRRLPRAQ